MLFVIPILFIGAFIYPYIPGHGLPWCAIKICTGVDCPGCGMVRSISALVHGRFLESFRFHPLGFVVAGFLVYLWLAKLFKWPIGGKGLRYGSYVFVLLLIAEWVVRLAI